MAADDVGDLTLLGKYQVIRSDQKDLDLSFLFGIKVPTGTTRRTNLMGRRFEADRQPGPGSWDPLVGIAASTLAERYQTEAMTDNSRYMIFGKTPNAE